MTDAATAPAKTSFHPELEAIFDNAQTAPVPMAAQGKDMVILSVKAFEDALEAASLAAADVRHRLVERGEKPNVVLVEQATFNNLATIKDFFADMPSWREFIDADGKKFLSPTDENDAALLAMAEGATFAKTTFPSGWVSPDETHVARDGRLYEAD